MQTRFFIHIVLSLLLLISQQLGFAHAAAHWNSDALGTAHAHPVADTAGGTAPQSLLELACDECIAFGQIATALPFDLYSPPAVLPASFIAAHPVVSCTHLPTPLGYQSRAPPAFS